MKHYCFHDEHGRIYQYGRCPESALAVQSFGEYTLKVLPNNFVVPSSDEHYINPEGQHRACEDYSLDALPLPCEIVIEGVEYSVTEQPEFEFDAPGEYRVLVKPRNGQFKVKEFSIEN